MTERGRYHGNPWIAAEPSGETLASIPGHLGLELRAGTSFDFAKTLASYLNTHIVAIMHTQI